MVKFNSGGHCREELNVIVVPQAQNQINTKERKEYIDPR